MNAFETAPRSAESERLQVVAHLEEILGSPAFSGSRRRQAFLRYVVEETLAGRGAAIKERNIAVDVFDRQNDFDAQSASIVRVTGGEVRKRLAQAYASGLNGGIRIELPLGSYHPAFHFLTEEAVPAEPALAERVDEPQPTRRFWPLAALGAVVILAAVVLVPRMFHKPTATDMLWAPFVDSKNPVLLSPTSPTLLHVPHWDKWLPLRPGTSIPVEELMVMDNSYVGTGGALGVARFAEQLAFRHQPFVLKFGSDLAFSDLKSAPALLLGASRWVQELTQNLRYRFDRLGDLKAIVDTRVAGRVWSVSRVMPKTDVTEGYSMVTRILNSDSGHPVLIVVGLDARDTQSGVEFLSNESVFKAFTETLPADWGGKSFQVVLHNSIHGNSAGSLTVVASEVW